MQHIDHIVQLLSAYLKGHKHPDSDQELLDLLNRYPELHGVIQELSSERELKQALRQYEEIQENSSTESEKRMLRRVVSGIRETRGTKRTRTARIRWYSIAASIAACFIIGTYLWQAKQTKTETDTLEIAASLSPGTNRAVLTTSDGRQIELSEAHGRVIIDKQVQYEDGTVLYDTQSEQTPVNLTLSTPRGGQYQVVLSDGTNVWLNADTRLRYPQSFTGTHRTVELEGEAYFEVAAHKTRPFIVQTPTEKVEVLGTHFNVTAYQDEGVSYVALIEGKVNVSLPDETTETLLPGQQSVVNDGMLSVKPVNVNESIAWKNGEFMFNNENLESVMQKLSRWYDIEAVVDPKLKDIEIWGSISRYDNFDQVLRVIKMTDDRIKFKIEGRRVILMT